MNQLFEELSDPYNGKCYRFNSEKNSYGEHKELLNSTTSTGYWTNLVVEFNLKTPVGFDYSEIALVIHNQSHIY